MKNSLLLSLCAVSAMYALTGCGSSPGGLSANTESLQQEKTSTEIRTVIVNGEIVKAEYAFKETNCSTGLQSVTSKVELCARLQNSTQNNNCALDKRKKAFATYCENSDFQEVISNTDPVQIRCVGKLSKNMVEHTFDQVFVWDGSNSSITVYSDNASSQQVTLFLSANQKAKLTFQLNDKSVSSNSRFVEQIGLIHEEKDLMGHKANVSCTRDLVLTPDAYPEIFICKGMNQISRPLKKSRITIYPIRFNGTDNLQQTQNEKTTNEMGQADINIIKTNHVVKTYLGLASLTDTTTAISSNNHAVGVTYDGGSNNQSYKIDCSSSNDISEPHQVLPIR